MTMEEGKATENLGYTPEEISQAKKVLRRAAAEHAKAQSDEPEQQTKNHLGTPLDVLVVVEELGPIALDPCSNRWSIVRAAVELDGSTPEKDGLAADWHALALGGLVFVNPPYGRGHMRKWSAKIVREAAAGCELVVLVKGDHTTAWWHVLREAANAVCYWSKRIEFRGEAEHGANFASAFFYFGRRPHLFAHAFGPHGDVRVLG